MRFKLRKLGIRAKHTKQILCARQVFIGAMDVQTAVFFVVVVAMVAIDGEHGKNGDEHQTLTKYVFDAVVAHTIIIACKGEHATAERVHHVGCGGFHHHIANEVGR